MGKNRKAASKGPVEKVLLKHWQTLHSIENDLEDAMVQYEMLPNHMGSDIVKSANELKKALERLSMREFDIVLKNERDWVRKHGTPDDIQRARRASYMGVTIFADNITLPSKQMMGYVMDMQPQWYRMPKDVETYVIDTILREVKAHKDVLDVSVNMHRPFRSFNLTVECRPGTDSMGMADRVEHLIEKAIVGLAREFDEVFVRDMEIGEVSIG